MSYLQKIRILLKKRIPFRVRLLALLAILYFTGFLTPLFKGDVTVTLTMPGTSYTGALPPLTTEEEQINQHLHAHVKAIAEDIGERNVRHYAGLERAADYISGSFRTSGYDVQYQQYSVAGKSVRNIEAILKGSKKPEQILVVGAHYDSFHGASANDNGSGVAALLELARLLKDTNPERTIRFVAFVNEEPPFFQTKDMGSYVYAKRSHERGEDVYGMFSLETMGYYSDEKESQHYPFPLSSFYPDTGNFIGFVGNSRSKALVEKTVGLFREHVQFPSEGASITEYIRGVGWSDQWSFWQFDYPALMITDTAPYRYPYYHSEQDTIDKIDFDKLARVVNGLGRVIGQLSKQ